MALNLRIRLGYWLRTAKGLNFLLIAGIVSFILLAMIVTGNFPPKPDTATLPPSDSDLTSSNSEAAAKRELKKLAWVKDTYVSPGYMNVGVVKNEKDWQAPMIGSAVCGILLRTGSNIKSVRFVDIEKIVREQVPAQSAEVAYHNCD